MKFSINCLETKVSHIKTNVIIFHLITRLTIVASMYTTLGVFSGEETYLVKVPFQIPWIWQSEKRVNAYISVDSDSWNRRAHREATDDAAISRTLHAKGD